MGFFDSLGLKTDFLGNFSFAGIAGGIVIVFLIFFVILFAGGITFAYYYKKLNKNAFRFQIPLYTRTHGKYSRIGIDMAKEVFIPDSNISLFYLKKRKIYTPRPTRKMGTNEYWIEINDNGEWVNFDLSTDPDKDTLALANYDHRDTRYAYVNLKDLIKKNYKDKSVTWWKEHAALITLIVCGLVMAGVMWWFFHLQGKLSIQNVEISKNLVEAAKNIAEAVKGSQNLNSGIIGAN